MARNKSTFTLQLEYHVVRGLWGLLRRLPLATAVRTVRLLLNSLLFFLPDRRQIIQNNLAACFPHLTPSQRQNIADESIDNLVRGIARVPRLPDLFKGDVSDWISGEGLHHAQEAFQKGRGMIFFTAHYGFWEAMPLYFQKYCGPFNPVARPLDNPWIDQLISSVRGANGAQVIIQHAVLKQGMRRLRNNEILGFLTDQNFYKGGIFVDFFGRPASSTTIVSLLARRAECPVIPVHSVWRGDRLQIVIERPMTLSSHPDVNTAVAEDTQMMATIMEGWIREVPGQWLWLHDRWKRRPEPGDRVYTSDINHVSRAVQG